MFEQNAVQITPEILRLIAEIDEFKGAWQALGRIAPERLTALRHVATIESIGSSTRIEGSRLTDRQVETLLSGLRIQAFATRDEQEVAGYANVMDTVFAAWADIPLTENHIRQLHRDLLRYSEKDAWHRGSYKKSPNHVVASDADGKQIGVVFETASPFDTPRRMAELVEGFRQALEDRSTHPLVAIGLFIVVFLEIHPFQDGNGRLSRILTTLLLLRAGYAYVPFSSLESVVEQNKETYYRALRRTQITVRTDAPDWTPWLVFFLQSLRTQALALRQKVEREQLLVKQHAPAPDLILAHARLHGRITMEEAERLTGVSRNTLKVWFRKWVAQGTLALEGKGRASWYKPL